MTGAHRPVLVFDGECGFCTRSAWLIRRWLPVDCEIVAWQEADLEALGVTAEWAAEAVQWVEGDRTWAGPEAVGHLLLAAGGAAGGLGRLVLSGPGGWVAGPLYRWVADHRHRLPGSTPACRLPEEERRRLRTG